MQAKKRYLLVLLSVAFLLFCYFGGLFRRKLNKSTTKQLLHRILMHKAHLRNFTDWPVEDADTYNKHDHVYADANRFYYSVTATNNKTRNCRMETCFDFSLCKEGFKIYVYPEEEKVSELYSKILRVIRDSRYYTSDPTLACIFVLGIDTLDRDTLSIDYSHNIDYRIAQKSTALWNGGVNHLIFNLYSGTFPDYSEDLKFNIGHAMLAKASMSTENFRPGFDISIPLFPKSHQLKGVEKGNSEGSNFPASKKHLLVFKGKRYVYGIGSETRNSLFHLHNGRDVILVTTCKHNKDWKKRRDDRCDEDQDEFDKYDYRVLLQNSTFCLVPRGRRLGSFRYLESLQSACIPVLLSNNFELPFSDIINWNKAVLWADERLLLQVTNLLRTIPPVEVLSLQQHTQFLWETYFSSVESIVSTTLAIIQDRITTLTPLIRTSNIWNTVPGGLIIDTHYSDNLKYLPFYTHQGTNYLGNAPTAKNSPQTTPPFPHYTAVIHVGNNAFGVARSPSALAGQPSKSVVNLLKQLSKSIYIGQILVVCQKLESVIPQRYTWPSLPDHIKFQVLRSTEVVSHILYDGVLSVSDDCHLSSEEFDFAFTVWKTFPDRMIGYLDRLHYWNDVISKYAFTSKYTNAYSMILVNNGGAAFYHKYYHYLLKQHLEELQIPEILPCTDMFINFIIAHCVKLPPIKLSQRHVVVTSSANITVTGESLASSKELGRRRYQFKQQQKCMDVLHRSVFGYMPLVASSTRLDPVLYKDPVSRLRKKYNKMESAAAAG